MQMLKKRGCKKARNYSKLKKKGGKQIPRLAGIGIRNAELWDKKYVSS